MQEIVIKIVFKVQYIICCNRLNFFYIFYSFLGKKVSYHIGGFCMKIRVIGTIATNLL